MHQTPGELTPRSLCAQVCKARPAPHRACVTEGSFHLKRAPEACMVRGARPVFPSGGALSLSRMIPSDVKISLSFPVLSLRECPPRPFPAFSCGEQWGSATDQPGCPASVKAVGPGTLFGQRNEHTKISLRPQPQPRGSRPPPDTPQLIPGPISLSFRPEESQPVGPVEASE